MKKVIFFFLSLCVGSVRADFFPNTEDIPIMDGIILTEITDFEFDTPMGQILTFDSKTDCSQKQVRSFYQETLKSLGWSLEKEDVYVRGNDRFSIYFPTKNRIRFEMTLVGSEF